MPAKRRHLRIAIVGRPNVGKSTLFNRLVGQRIALVDDQPGVTRDRREGEARIADLRFTAIDTAGLDEAGPETLAGRMTAQTEAAIAEADLSLFMIDTRAGITPLDSHFAELLRRGGKPVVLVANKAEGKAGEGGFLESYSLGLGEPVAISAEHGQGMSDLQDAIVDAVDDSAPLEEDEESDEAPGRGIKIAVVGRPNAGKSTLINRMIGEDRLLTGPEAGLTRDSIAIDWRWRERDFRLFDTAGLRRKSNVQTKLEKLAVGDSLRAIRFAEIVVLVLDALSPFEKQDLQIADLIVQEGRALVIAVNKWDLVRASQARLAELRETCERLLPQIKGVAFVPVSALTGKGIDKLLGAVLAADALWNKRLPTHALNQWLREAVDAHSPPAVSGRRIKLRYITQSNARPPTFVLFCSRPKALPDSYVRYLVNSLRETFELPGVPIRLHLRKGENPYAKGSDQR
jgi:GTP-binding protein